MTTLCQKFSISSASCISWQRRFNATCPFHTFRQRRGRHAKKGLFPNCGSESQINQPRFVRSIPFRLTSQFILVRRRPIFPSAADFKWTDERARRIDGWVGKANAIGHSVIFELPPLLFADPGNRSDATASLLCMGVERMAAGRETLFASACCLLS